MNRLIRLLTGRYTRELECEVSELKAERLRLLNIIGRLHGLPVEQLEGVKVETKPQRAKKEPWRVTAQRIEARVAKMPREVVMSKMGNGQV